MFEYSSWSTSRMRIPPRTTTAAVAATMTPAADRTEGGSRRKRDIRRSIRLGRGTRGTFPLVATRRHRRDHRTDDPEERQEDAGDEHHPVPLPERHHPEREDEHEVQQAAETDTPPHSASLSITGEGLRLQSQSAGQGGASPNRDDGSNDDSAGVKLVQSPMKAGLGTASVAP